MPICQDCDRSFSSPTCKRAHVCKVLESSNFSFGAIIPPVTFKLMKSGMIVMEKISNVDAPNDIPSREAMVLLLISHSFNRCLARHCKQGKMYGDNFIARFKDNISDMFKRGEHDKGTNMTAEIMEVELQRRYLSQVPEIKSYVSQLMKSVPGKS